MRLGLAAERRDSLPCLMHHFSNDSLDGVFMKIPKDLFIGSIHSSNKNGNFKVISYISHRKVLVQFSDTGYEAFCQPTAIRLGQVRDPYFKSVFGVGYIGSYTGPASKIDSYICWKGMIARCYSNLYQSNNKTYIGCFVHEDWHNFSNFKSWYDDNYPKDGCKYQIDKDIKIDGNKLYSPGTCMFVTAQKNSEAAHSKRYSFISPSGDIIHIYNMAKFCRENELTTTRMIKVHKEMKGAHKGWNPMKCQ